MAGDWIKFETATLDKPEVWEIATELNIDPDAVIGKLLRVWSWFDSHSENGNAPSVTLALLDRNCGVTGFVNAMINCGWMEQKDGTIVLPNFERHNGQTAKSRVLTAKRVAKHKKSNAEGNGVSVTSALPREEKRREEKNKSNDASASDRTPSSSGKKKNFVERPESIPKQIWDDWLAARKTKRLSPPTVTAMRKIVEECKKANISLLDAIRICAERGWGSFDSTWDYGRQKPQEKVMSHWEIIEQKKANMAAREAKYAAAKSEGAA